MLHRSSPLRAAVLVSALAALLGLSACQRNDAPTPGVAGGSANPPASPDTRQEVPQNSDAQVGAGKSPGGPTSADRIPPSGSTGMGGAGGSNAPAPAEATQGAPAQAPGTAASAPPAVPPASAPGS